MRSFCIFSTNPATLYLVFYIFPTMYKEIGFLMKFYETVNIVAALYFDDLIGGTFIFCDII